MPRLLQDGASIDLRQGALLMAIGPTVPARSLGGRLVDLLHEHLRGACTSTAGRRSACYRRQQLRGLHPVTLDDLADLALMPTREAREAVRAVALELLAAVEPAAGDSVPLAAARYAAESADVAPAVLRAVADGAVTAEEAEAIAREVHEARSAEGALLGALARIA
jgi:hypothetical protein